MSPKKLKNKLKAYVLRQLEDAAKRFLASHSGVRVVVVTGSVGKTSTKLAITRVLEQKYRVLVGEKDNYNTEFSVPLGIMKIPYPTNPNDPLQWWAVLKAAKMRPSQPFPYDIIVLELGTDKPGDIAAFGRYIKADIAVVTAVSPEHMEFFKTMEAVATEELSVAKFAKLLVINRDDIEEKYAHLLPDGQNIDTYGVNGVAEYHFLLENTAADGFMAGKLVSPEYGEQSVKLGVIGEQSVKPVVAGALVGIKMGLGPEAVVKGVEAFRPVPGRMQLLRGYEDSLIIDDTYNASPLAVIAGLKTLYTLPHQHKIAILGSMNELGEFSEQAHTEVGQACDSNMLEWVITIGKDAEKYLAPAASRNGCQTRSFIDPHEAGSFVHSVLKPNTAILAEGSQNGVFAEEAVKMLLHSTEDEMKLVRQSEYWRKLKDKHFNKF